MTATSTDALVFPASPGQQRLWFLTQINPEAGPAYALAARLDLRGAVDEVALQRALNTVADRHEALRTGLRRHDDRVVQLVLPGVAVPLDVVDLTAAGPDRGARLERLLSFAARRPWDLATPPLLRAALVRLEPGRSVLLLCVHHAVCDGISLQVLLEELLAAYRQGELPGEPAQFADYVIWNSGGLEPGQDWKRRRQAGIDHWKDVLRGAPDALELPADHRRPPAQSFAGAREPVRLPAHLARQVREWAVKEGVSVATALLTAFLTVLHRNSGADDLVVGLPVANRDHPDLAGVVGFLANVCPLRARIPSGLTLRGLAHQVDRSVVDLLEHAGVPFGELVGALNPPRLLDRNPVFQTLFGFQPGFPRERTLPGLRVNVTDVDTGTARADLSLFLFEEAGGEIAGFLEYATALFTPGTARRLTAQFRMVVDRLLHGPDAPAACVRLTDARLADVRRGRGGPGATWPMPWAEVKRHAQATPEAPALADDETTLTYRDLVERTEAAAAALSRAGARPGTHVAVHLRRGAGLGVAVLACLAAGAVYVPVDPSAPDARRRSIFEAAAPALTVCDAPGDLAGLPTGATLTLADLRSAPSAERGPDVPSAELGTVRPAAPAAEFGTVGPAAPSVEPGPDVPSAELGTVRPAVPSAGFGAVDPDAPAYLMFTSGSTGRPKGVLVSRRNLASLLAVLGEELGLRPQDRLLALTTTSFDISLLELLAPLAAGAAVQIAPEQAQRDGAELAGRLSDPAITLAQATPATWRMALDSGWRPGPGLRVLCGGEAMPPDLADGLSGASTTWNLYGPTETTIWSCAAEALAGRPVTIGGPIPHTEVFVVDEELNPVPPGVCGELLIGGPGVAIGYLGDPALTAARFLPAPYGGARVYRTGDLVRLRDDGDLEYVGRADDQVKLRGHRIEPGEVEAVLRTAPGVRDAAVALSGRGASTRLVACLVPAAGADAGPGWPAEVRRHAGTVLPAAMLPAELRVAAAVPLSPNGKVDRRAVPGTGRRLEIGAGRVPPRTEAERRVAALFAELLDVPEVGATDDFFALGGHSVLVGRLIQRVEAELGARIPVLDIFMDPTVARVAETVARTRGEIPGTTGPEEPPDTPGDEDWEFEPVRADAASRS
ncbi:amino acid adenylation domain-containing protein [Nonomuraea typhae]|uniref:Amino acid adenylation domain-containing protein n=1 Tax=Nonomuraea typhae TaxID=2603600 RepID=A0ABW7Z9H9_9ACTN